MIAELAARLAEDGLILRGGFHPAVEDSVPGLGDGRATATLLLVGNTGPAMWARFAASAERLLERDPLDTWTRRVLAPVAAAFGAELRLPFGGPPHLPFQRWALRAEDVHVSPLKLLIHPEYGLWHAYRGALAFAQRLDLERGPARPSPCASCADRPCLAACPVDAFDGATFAAARCADHIHSDAGADCLDAGCRARLACPAGSAFRQSADQRGFHMRAFAHGAARGSAG